MEKKDLFSLKVSKSRKCPIFRTHSSGAQRGFLKIYTPYLFLNLVKVLEGVPCPLRLKVKDTGNPGLKEGRVLGLDIHVFPSWFSSSLNSTSSADSSPFTGPASRLKRNCPHNFDFLIPIT